VRPKLYGPVFALLLARLIGHRQPLIDRLRHPEEKKTSAEHEFLADVLASPRKWPTPEQVLNSREKLRRAAYFLEYRYGSGGKVRPEDAELLGKDSGSKLTDGNAELLAARKCKVDEKTIKRAVKYARALGNGEWWRSAEHLAKKGPRKRESLHRTY